MDTVETFKPHAAEIRKHLCDVMLSLGLALVALENCELSAGADGGPDEDGVSAIIMSTHLEEMAAELDAAGDHLTAINDKVSLALDKLEMLRRTRSIEASDEEGHDNGVGYRVRSGEGGAS